MKKELVKVGMKVIDKYGDVITIVRHHIAEPEKVDGVNKDGMYVVDIYTSSIEPYEEPKEGLEKCHPIPNPFPDVDSIKTDEQIKRDTEYINAFKSYLDENANENYKSPQEIQEYYDNYFKELYGDKDEPITERIDGWFVPQGNPLAPPNVKFPKEEIDNHYSVGYESNAPITQEFIESFGFVKVTDGQYEKDIIDEDTELPSKLYLAQYKDGLWGFFDGGYDVIFKNYTCATQSELRFLLTKGRIDCSK